jgi:hypothetical protein
VKWRKSEAKKIVYNALMDGVIPLKDTSFKVMSLEYVYSIDPEFALYDFKKFKDRVNRIRKKILELDKRAEDDLAAFKNYKDNHEPSILSHKGYVQWQGSSAQEFLWEDLDAYIKDPGMKPKDLWQTCPEHRKEFPLKTFADKIKQEIRTAKYLHTLKERGKERRSS